MSSRKLFRSETAIETCERHLAESGSSNNAEVEAILASFVAATIYAEAEAQIVDMVRARLAGDGSDEYVSNYSKMASKRLVRSIKIGEISGIAGHFHSACKDQLQASLQDEDRVRWDSLMGARHAVAHDSEAPPLTLTLDDVKAGFESVSRVLACFDAAINGPSVGGAVAPADNPQADECGLDT